MTLEWPQITYLILTVIGFVLASIKLGKTGQQVEFWSNIISTIAILFILYCGGFFG